ncbi:GNAT family N-acetyltransferase [Qipengyuania gaetbuli]|uniref:GNAT family N-acetyltransferase n=1 Tax=Qipengyuania gaetbuli TaxID=266952 RepID=UPI001CD6ADFA|nr:GNAT family N-acetyltransferase [Qipengyuania gaetbuli]MCA0909369.1 GNAT family N-acetyltransferase [Qipengyuania gaetbuli]
MSRHPLPVQDDQRHSGGVCPLADGFHLRSWRDPEVGLLADSWDDLAAHASTPNPFYERWYLMPSLAAFDPDGHTGLGLFLADGKLRGLVPIARSTSYHGRRLPHLAGWLHPNIFSGNPLVAAGEEQRFWSACLDWLDAAAGDALFFHLRSASVGEPLVEALAQECRKRGRSMRKVYAGERAELRSPLDAETYLARAMTAKARKELRRQRKRLAELGRIEWRQDRGETGLDDWTADFLALEQRGWKGSAGSALADDPRTAELFRQALAGAAATGRLERLALTCDDRPIAMLATFLSPPGAFAFKTAFDEDFARFSPGLQLQVENLALLGDGAIDWCDSCAEPGHSMIERIWMERRPFAYYTIPIGSGIRRKVGGALAWLEERRQEKRA